MFETELMPAEELEKTLGEHIRDVPDFPKPGIVFKDITTLLKRSEMLRLMSEQIAVRYRDAKIDYIAGIESRGFILGMPVAYLLDAGFIPVRKPGKLPAATVGRDYELEYGTDRLEVHKDAIEPGKRVLIVDDLLATGGTAAATFSLLQEVEADVVGAVFAIELTFLNGREKLAPCQINSLIKY